MENNESMKNLLKQVQTKKCFPELPVVFRDYYWYQFFILPDLYTICHLWGGQYC